MFAVKDKEQQQQAFASGSKSLDEQTNSASQIRESVDSPRTLQRNLGNGYLQSISQMTTNSDGLPLQRACACGSTCAKCAAKRDEQYMLQPKLIVGSPNDNYEQEADLITKQINQTPFLQQQIEPEEENNGIIHSKVTPAPTPPNSAPSPFEVPPIVHDVLRSPGQLLDAGTRAFMESRFGHDFSGVRVHTDAKAAESARSVNALAYTVGRDIVFQPEYYSPGSTEGKRLLAHELTHVLQQNQAVPHTQRAELKANKPVEVTSIRQPMLNRLDLPYPGAISRCRSMGVPCPAPHFHHGTVCRLVSCSRAATANLPFAISPGICIYQCLDGQICTCVLFGTATSAVCVITLCDSAAQASNDTDYEELVTRAVALAEQQIGNESVEQDGGQPDSGATLQAKLEIGESGNIYEREADRIADHVLSVPEPAITLYSGLAGERWCGTMTATDTPSQAVPMLQRQVIGGAPACPTAVNFNFTEPAHVPHCGGPALRATTDVTGATWSLTAGSAAVDPGSTIAGNGTITLAATQAAGDINARATAGGCFFEQPFTIRSHPVGIASTSFVSASTTGNYGGTFDHVFDSADGNVASLANVGVGERFTNVPNPAGAAHNITAPLNPFGGVFTLNTATLTPGATNNWFLTATGGLGGTLDSVTTGQANINVGRFVQSASNPTPPQGLPASMTLLQQLHWFCPQKPAANRWTGFVTVAHSRTLRNVGGTIEFVTAVNGIDRPEPYVGPTAVSNLTATPARTPRSASSPAGGGTAPPPQTVAITVDTLPTVLPSGQTITWSIVGNALGCTIAQDPSDDHAAVLTIGTTAGTVTVETTDSTRVNRARVRVVIT